MGVMGVSVVSIMLMAPPGSDGAAEVDRYYASVTEVQSRLSSLPSEPDALRKELLAVADMLSKASEGLDCVKLVGAQRERRRTILKEIEGLEAEIAKRKSSL